VFQVLMATRYRLAPTVSDRVAGSAGTGVGLLRGSLAGSGREAERPIV
jgi:hypothetical protein